MDFPNFIKDFSLSPGAPDKQLAKTVAAFGLHITYPFYLIGNMETTEVVMALAALAQETRLAVYRLLVQAGPAGLPAGEIAGRLAVPPATASFHLSQLTHAGLLQSRSQGRFIIYSVNFECMNDLLGFLTENCCGGQACIPSARSSTDEAAAKPVKERTKP